MGIFEEAYVLETHRKVKKSRTTNPIEWAMLKRPKSRHRQLAVERASDSYHLKCCIARVDISVGVDEDQKKRYCLNEKEIREIEPSLDSCSFSLSSMIVIWNRQQCRERCRRTIPGSLTWPGKAGPWQFLKCCWQCFFFFWIINYKLFQIPTSAV